MGFVSLHLGSFSLNVAYFVGPLVAGATNALEKVARAQERPRLQGIIELLGGDENDDGERGKREAAEQHQRRLAVVRIRDRATLGL